MSKGHNRRPSSVSQQTYNENWERTFGRGGEADSRRRDSTPSAVDNTHGQVTILTDRPLALKIIDDPDPEGRLKAMLAEMGYDGPHLTKTGG